MATHETQAHSNTKDTEDVRHNSKSAERLQGMSKEQDGEENSPDPNIWTTIGPRSIEQHAALLGDRQSSNCSNATQASRVVLKLQRDYGNSYVQRLMGYIQAKLVVNPPDDEHEKEADRAAEIVTNRAKLIVTPQVEAYAEEGRVKPEISSITPVVQLSVESKEEDEHNGQAERSQLSTLSDNLEAKINASRSSGRLLPNNVQIPMEQAYGADFSTVRVHTDSVADELNQRIGARAFTTGNDIFFREGEYSPNSDRCQGLIAHELAHVIQQSDHVQAQGLEKEEVTKKPKVNFTTKVGRIWLKIQTGLMELQGLRVISAGEYAVLYEKWAAENGPDPDPERFEDELKVAVLPEEAAWDRDKINSVIGLRG